MRYSLKRIVHNLKKHFPVYLLFVLQFAVGILILCSTLNVLISLQKELKRQQEEMAAENAIELVSNAYFEGNENERIEADSLKQGMDVSYDVYLKLAEKFKKDFTFQYGVETSMIGVFVWRKEDDFFIDLADRVDVWFVNDELFQAYFGVPMEQDKIYAGKNAYEALGELKEYVEHPDEYSVVYWPTNVLYYENGEYTVAHKEVFQLAHMPPTEKKQIKPSEPDWTLYNEVPDDFYYRPDVVDCIFIPMSAFPVYEEFHDSLDWEGELKEWRREAFSNFLKAQAINPNYKTETVSEMLAFLMKESHLRERNITVEFTLNEKQLAMQEFAEYIKSSMNSYLVMAISVLLVVLLGTTGLFLIFLYRRKRQMAVALAYGSTRKRLFWELFAEIFAVTGFGAILGLLSLQFTAEFFQSFYAETTFQISCAVIALLIAAFTALITSILAFIGVGEIAPAKILKEL